MATNRRSQLAQILVTSIAGDSTVNALTPPTPDQIQQYGGLLMQAAITIVTIWAAIRKALQKPVVQPQPAPNVSAA